jgi:predicted dehydrogenase
MLRVALVGLGKMGVSHYAIANAHPDAEVVAICDTFAYALDVVHKYTGVATYTSYAKMLGDASIDAVIVATPTRSHAAMVEQALERGLHVFCEKPFGLDASAAPQLINLAKSKGLTNQVGYHYRFVGAFQEMKRVLDAGLIGRPHHALAEAYGPVVLKPKGMTWRMQSAEGGGSLYDYAAHPINLLNWYFGEPGAVGGSARKAIFSRDTDDEVYSTLFFDDGPTAQLSVNWSDESQRKMSTKISIWGTNGRITADRQECQVYLREHSAKAGGEAAGACYKEGWNVRYGTELNEPVWFYVRGEEYSAQLDHFIRCAAVGASATANSFESAAVTDRVIAMIAADAAHSQTPASVRKPTRKFPFFQV